MRQSQSLKTLKKPKKKANTKKYYKATKGRGKADIILKTMNQEECMSLEKYYKKNKKQNRAKKTKDPSKKGH